MKVQGLPACVAQTPPLAARWMAAARQKHRIVRHLLSGAKQQVAQPR